MIPLLLEQGLPRGAAVALRMRGFVAEHVGELSMAASPDEAILQYASDHGFTIVTLDADFHTLLAATGSRQPSVIRLRAEGMKAEEAAQVILAVVERCQSALLAGAAVSANRESIRVRLLPFGQ